jgi:hypothetical protein
MARRVEIVGARAGREKLETEREQEREEERYC